MTDIESRLKNALRDETSDVFADPALAETAVGQGRRVRRRHRLVGGAAVAVVAIAVAVPVVRVVDHGTTAPIAPATHGPSVTQDSPVTRHTPTAPWPTHAVDVALSPKVTPQVLDMRVGGHPGYDRFVIDLKGAMPGYRISYVRSIARPSGKPVDLPGSAILAIRLTPAEAHTPAGVSSFSGATTQSFDLPVLRGASLVEDFEGNVTLALGLSRRTGFHILALSSPTRLVIDVQR